MAEAGQYESCPKKSGKPSPYQIVLKHGVPEYLELKLDTHSDENEEAGDYLEPISGARAQEHDTDDYLLPLCSTANQEDSDLRPTSQEEAEDHLLPTSKNNMDDYLRPTGQADTDDYLCPRGEKTNQEDVGDYLHPPGSTMHQITPGNRSLTPLPPLPEEAMAANYEEIELEDFYEEVPDIRGEQSNSTVMNNSQDGKAKSKRKRNRVFVIVGVTIGVLVLLSSAVLLVYFFAPRNSEENDCFPNPCQNGAGCTDQVTGYSCICLPGYTGTICETDINECSPNPCQNGAGCTDQVNSYSCSCLAGYTDTNCETDINDCSPNPCLNGATCTDLVNGYSCSCLDGYTGMNCGTNIDDCSPNPCQNGAGCTDQVNAYSCSCLPGYTGTNCEYAFNFTQGEVVAVTEPGMFTRGITGVTTTTDGLIVVCETPANKVHILTDTLQPVTVINFHGEFPYDAAELDGLLYITGWESYDIHVYHMNGTYVKRIGSRGTGPGQFYFPKGITVSGGRLIVCEWGGRRIQVMHDRRWEIFPVEMLDGGPHFIAVSPDLSRIAVTTRTNHLYIFNTSFHLIHTVSIPYDGYMFGVVFDQYGRIIACDNKNDKLYIIGLSYDLFIINLSETLINPYDVTITQTGDLIISHGVHEKRVVRLYVPLLTNLP